MNPTRLYLIRHAHTAADHTLDSVYWQLSTRGAEEAIRLAGQPFWSEVALIALSSELKTRLTVAPLLAQRGLPVVVDSRFDELQRPGWVENYERQVAQAFALPDQAAGAWEPASAALARILDGIADLVAHHPGRTLALVGHGLTLSLYRAHLLGRSRVEFDEWRQLGFATVALVDPVTPALLADFTL
ncbi:MAG TPA: histidine phosphatase family protein [Caldilineaceae bacterium]|nr:histidine phosphatase family protein [Caldilineaceae bacterium]